MADPQPNRNLAGVLLMSAAVLLFSLNDVLGKWLVATYPVAQLLVLRSVAALAVLAPLVARRGGGWPALLRPKRPGLQALRVACGTLEVAAFYWAVSLMPLADAMAFWMATPILVAVASAAVLGERLGAARLAAILLGFGGVVLALGAGLGSGLLPVLAASGGVVAYTGYLLCTRALRGTSASVLAVYQMAGALVFGLALLPLSGWVAPGWVELALLLLLGLVGTGAHLMVTRSLHLAPAAVVVPWQYAMILWAILFGWLAFAEVPAPLMLVGAGLIVAAGLWLSRLDLRRAG